MKMMREKKKWKWAAKTQIGRWLCNKAFIIRMEHCTQILHNIVLTQSLYVHCM